MPTDHRLGLHDDHGRTPVSPGVSKQHPKQSISRTEWRTLDRALEHRQLLTEGQVLKGNRAVSAAHQREGTEQDKKRGRHERSCAAIEQRINQSLTIRIVANDNVGITSNVHDRLGWHNHGPSGHTVSHRPWSLVVSMEFATEKAARRFEKYLKSGSGRAFAKRHFAPA
jgi:putative endonuclease